MHLVNRSLEGLKVLGNSHYVFVESRDLEFVVLKVARHLLFVRLCCDEFVD